MSGKSRSPELNLVRYTNVRLSDFLTQNTRTRDTELQTVRQNKPAAKSDEFLFWAISQRLGGFRM